MFAKQSPIPLARSPRSPLLKPHSENLIYDIHSTETSANYILDPDILASQKRYLFCSFCQRVLQSKAGLTNHEKAHIRDNLKKERLERYKKFKKTRVYTCKECGEEFAQRGLLNKHVKTHINLIECNFCHKTFKDRMEFEIHDAISDGLNYESLHFHEHRTRSQSRLSCHNINQSVRSVSCNGDYYNGSRTPESIYGSASRKRSTRSISRLSMSSRVHERKKAKSVSDWIENNAYLPMEEFDDTASVRSYSMLSNSVSPAASTLNSRSSEESFVQDRFICSETNCMKTFPSLNWVTKHEMVEHKKLALFRCNECRKQFTTRGNLKLHRIRTHPDVLYCVLCDNAHHGVAAIERHFQKHQILSSKCDVCSKDFLGQYYLDKHLKHKLNQHKIYRKTRGTILIRVDRRETRKFIDLDELASRVPVNLSACDYNLFTDIEDRTKVDDLPWRS